MPRKILKKLKKKKRHYAIPILGDVIKKVAPRIGAKVLIEPEWGIVGQITYKSGRKRYFRYTSIDANTMGASSIAQDKGYANYFMRKMGYPVISGRTFYSDHWAEVIGSTDDITEAYKYAKKKGFPLIVKPNDGSQGSGVALVHNKTEFYPAMRAIFKHHKVAIVEEYKKGTDYRVVVLDNKIISGYERIPLNVVGDGKTSIKKLLLLKQEKYDKEKRDMKIRLSDPRMKLKLRKQNLSFGSVLKKDQKAFLLDNANLSTGGDSVDITHVIHPEFKKLAIKLTKDMGLRLCGVDLMIEGDIRHAPKKYCIIEINSAPGLDHYAKIGKEQEQVVEDLYLEVLKSLEH